MLSIRNEQLKVFEQDQQERFELQIIDYIRQYLPRYFAELQEPGVRALIPKAMAKAERYGTLLHADVTGIISLMLWLGTDFDSDPENAWAQEILGSPVLDPDSKIDWLFESLQSRLEE
jgi:hypothetical protein